MRFIRDCEIVARECVAPGHWRMRLHAPDIARAAIPGQFCMVEVSETLYPFLRRPMCFSEIHDDGVSILYKVEGEGTALLAQRVPGQKCSLQGPLGNGFPVDGSFERHIIVSGGIGVATFPALAQALVGACQRPPEVVLAARTRELLLCEDLFKGLGCTVYLATDDGSAGQKAYAAGMLERLNPGEATRVYACGPMIMMRTTAAVARRAGANCLVSLEAQMACGDGACLGCVVESIEEYEGEKMVRVCVDGPVFDAAIINWEAHNPAYDL
ncbi:MAG TPA: dihydroorotate dehydrogenase electron transfer subunit [Candidatus Hydrogenedentes bacterium]|nr:dihydroorotate dehydrogenase electron transfer subunit [Candidatus Hydrogenedentota bacterium]